MTDDSGVFKFGYNTKKTKGTKSTKGGFWEPLTLFPPPKRGGLGGVPSGPQNPLGVLAWLAFHNVLNRRGAEAQGVFIMPPPLVIARRAARPDAAIQGKGPALAPGVRPASLRSRFAMTDDSGVFKFGYIGRDYRPETSRPFGQVRRQARPTRSVAPGAASNRQASRPAMSA